MTNFARYSKALNAKIFLLQKKNIIKLNISDNEIGIEKNNINHSSSLGLVGMFERVNSINGIIDIKEVNNQGTTITIEVPIKE